MPRHLSLVFAAGAALAGSFGLHAAEAPPLTAEEILKKVTWPAEFDATVFASPPQVAYPIFVSAAADGTLFVGSDENGSLDRKPGRGKVIMCRDTDGDGKADQFTTFCTVDSPRGVCWDGSTRTLYVMHPPNLTAYHDDQGVGVANRQEDLITGLGFGLDYRGADHTTNGCRLAIDGWIYVAVGDYGAVKATGGDGRSLAMRGGGIVRVRPDGTGLEEAVHGTRNILSVAISPTMELFTRDNTNDGDDWNDRLSFNPFGAQMGYPTLFRNFPEEMIPTMFDFGGGSPVGSVFIDEPSLPKPWSYGFYSVEWGRSEIDLHALERQGAGWKLADTKQLMKMTRATDLDVDGAGRLYAASWDGATFTYNGPNVGYVIRLTGKGAQPPAAPDFKKLSQSDLVKNIGAESAVWRQAAQRELLVRQGREGAAPGLQKLAENSPNLGARVAAIFTLKQLLGGKATPALVSLAKIPGLREYALKAMADDQAMAAEIPAQPFLAALDDPDPRVRLQAVTGLGHLRKAEAAQALLARTADSDYTVAHVAVQALRWLRAAEVCLGALDSADEKVQPGALRVLEVLYEPAVVDGLLKRLDSPNAALRGGIFKALCRLDFQEAVYSDPKMWWGTRPDTSGPIYKPEPWGESEKIQAALKTQLEKAHGEEAKGMVTALMRHKVSFPGLTDLMLAKVGRDTASRLEVIQPLLSPKAPAPEDVLKALGNIATSAAEQPELRVRALRMLSALLGKNFPAVRDAVLPLATSAPPGPLESYWEEFTRDARLAQHARDFAALAREKDPAKRKFGATVLVNLATSTVLKDKKAKQAVEEALEELWKKPEAAAALLSAIGNTRATQFGPQVREHLNHPDHVVAEAAEFALTKLGLDKTGAPAAKNIGEMKYEDVAKIAIGTKGDAAAGQQFFLRQGCIACHTVSAAEPPKGPLLAGIASRYSRAELCESILKPSAKIAQGFESQFFKMKNGEQVEGFVVKEGGDSVEVRNIVGVTTVLEKGNILSREKREKSIMPEGLVANIAPEDLGSLLAYLESLKAQ